MPLSHLGSPLEESRAWFNAVEIFFLFHLFLIEGYLLYRIGLVSAKLGGGHGNPLQYSCLENPMDRGAWRATYSSWGHKELDTNPTKAAKHQHEAAIGIPMFSPS